MSGSEGPSQSQSDAQDKKNARIQWDDDKMETSFANVVNIQGTREQIEMFFGTNRTWNVSDDDAMRVELTNRIILTPLAAKRLLSLMNGVLGEYEQRHGALNLEKG